MWPSPGRRPRQDKDSLIRGYDLELDVRLRQAMCTDNLTGTNLDQTDVEQRFQQAHVDIALAA